jgi:hypothetical protein
MMRNKNLIAIAFLAGLCAISDSCGKPGVIFAVQDRGKLQFKFGAKIQVNHPEQNNCYF